MAGFNYYIDPDTDDYVIGDDGQFVRTSAADTPIILAIKDERGWWGNPQLGSDIADIMQGAPKALPAESLIDAAQRALAPLESRGRIRNLSVNITDREPLTVRVDAQDATGLPVAVVTKPIGI